MDDFVAVSYLRFDDDTFSMQPLHRGSKESCERVAELINALSYSGPKVVVESGIKWMRWDAWENLLRRYKEEKSANLK